MSAKIHRSKWGTYHPPVCKGHSVGCGCQDAPLWTIHDSRGYLDGGTACDECGACDCPDKARCVEHNPPKNGINFNPHDCIGLSFSYVCLDGGDNLCEECAAKAGIEIVDCDCA